jgi:hypothetical protein
MGDISYRVIFKGEIAPDADVNEVKIKIASITKSDSAKIQILFSGRNVIIKKNAALETCEKVRDAFKNAGAVSYIGEEKAPDANEQHKEPTPPPLPNLKELDGSPSVSEHFDKRADEAFCSACGEVIQLKTLKCPYCGKKQKNEGMGCLPIAIIITIISFFIIGILAAITIPQFLAYKNRSHNETSVKSNRPYGDEASVKLELMNLYEAEMAYYQYYGHYANNLTKLGFNISDPMVTIEIISVDTNCYEAKGEIAKLHKTYWINCRKEITEK